jgi:hypothetical protein
MRAWWCDHECYSCDTRCWFGNHDGKNEYYFYPLNQHQKAKYHHSKVHTINRDKVVLAAILYFQSFTELIMTAVVVGASVVGHFSVVETCYRDAWKTTENSTGNCRCILSCERN